MEGIIESNLLRTECAIEPEHGCVTVWSSGAAEQIEAMAQGGQRFARPTGSAKKASGERRYWAVCVDEVTGMNFDFELDSTDIITAAEEACACYNNVEAVELRPSSQNRDYTKATFAYFGLDPGNDPPKAKPWLFSGSGEAASFEI